ncbi:MAG: hypothetical protein R3B07_34695 [Polyangiaceae bacterium]
MRMRSVGAAAGSAAGAPGFDVGRDPVAGGVADFPGDSRVYGWRPALGAMASRGAQGSMELVGGADERAAVERSRAGRGCVRPGLSLPSHAEDPVAERALPGGVAVDVSSEKPPSDLERAAGAPRIAGSDV